MMAPPIGKKLEPVQCSICGFSSKRITTVEEHIQTVHNKTAKQLWDEIHNGPVLCACGCGAETKFLNYKNGYSTMINGHNGSIYKIYDQDKAEQISNKRKQKLIGQVGWAKGLTKETDERIAQRAEATSVGRKQAFASGSIAPWSKGLTKETDERLKACAEQQKQKFADGILVPWAKGLTKETDQRIQNMATKVSITHTQTKIRNRLDDLKRLKIDEIKSRIENSGKLRLIESSIQDYINDNTANIVVECNTCHMQTQGTLRKLQRGRCFNCDPGGSVAQHEVSDWVKSLGVTVDVGRRDLINGLELDIYMPDQKFAIEYNGLYWHSIAHKSMLYHQNKTDRCVSSNISLFHLFEDEWRDKRAIVQSMIKHRLGLTATKIFGRACKVRALTTQERKDFFNANHIDGDTNAKHAIGLEYNNEIVSAISLRTPFHKSHAGSLEVARFCSKLDTSVAGGLGRLTKAARQFAASELYTSLLTYVDTRLGAREGWKMAGWKQVAETPPRFWWTDGDVRYNRFKIKADKSRNLTEAQAAENANVVKIFACKNVTFEINLLST